MLNISAYEKVSFATCQNCSIFVVAGQTLLCVATNAREPELRGTSALLFSKPWDTREKSLADSGAAWLRLALMAKYLIPTRTVRSFQFDVQIAEQFLVLHKSGRKQLGRIAPDILSYSDCILLLNSAFMYVSLWVLPWLPFSWTLVHSRQNLCCNHV